MNTSLLEPELAPSVGERLGPTELGPIAQTAPPDDAAAHDRLAVGMVYLLAISVIQRGVGFVRNMFFCRLLAPEELGRWNLAFSFLMVAAPMAVLGIPGTFGRYAEHYRKHGHLQTFLRRTGAMSTILAVAFALIILAAPAAFAELVFRDRTQTQLMAASAFALVAVVAFNYIVELSTSLRRARVASRTQFIHSLTFSVAGLGLIVVLPQGASAVVLAYGGACLVACFATATAMRDLWGSSATARATIPQREFWSKLAPFAGWVWATTSLANLSDVADRYLILYFARGDANVGSALVGQYHSSRVVPDLLASIAVMLAGVMLPYNTHDWEAGNRKAVATRVRLAIKLISISMTAAGTAFLVLAGPLFAWVLKGKYADGEAVLSWTLLLCIYFGLTVVASNYLWCAERPGRAMLVTGIGLCINVLLNLLLLPRFGLTGAVAATAAANAIALMIAIGFNLRLGMKIDAGVVLAALAPLSLLLGPAAAMGAILALAAAGIHSDRLLPHEEKAQISQTLRRFGRR